MAECPAGLRPASRIQSIGGTSCPKMPLLATGRADQQPTGVPRVHCPEAMEQFGRKLVTIKFLQSTDGRVLWLWSRSFHEAHETKKKKSQIFNSYVYVGGSTLYRAC